MVKNIKNKKIINIKSDSIKLRLATLLNHLLILK